MKAYTSSRLVMGGLLMLGLSAGPALADQARSSFSGLGSDTNAPDCIRTAPCRTFQVAHDHTLANGEITVLDAGSYGAVTITKNISIINDGVGEAGALVSGGATGITINATSTDAVTLRGITIKGIGFGGGKGIVFNTGLSLTLENCVIRNMTGASPLGVGVTVQPSNNTNFAASNTTATDNENGGILVVPTGGTGILVSAVLNGVSLYNNGLLGLSINGSNADVASRVTATISNSVAGNTVGNGFWTVSATGKARTAMLLTNSVVAGNLVGLRADDPRSAIGVGGSTITSNSTNLITSGGSVLSWGNNYQSNNDTLNAFNFTLSLQ